LFGDAYIVQNYHSYVINVFRYVLQLIVFDSGYALTAFVIAVCIIGVIRCVVFM